MEILKLWPLLAFTLSIIVAAWKLGYMFKSLIEKADETTKKLGALGGMPEKLAQIETRVGSLERKVERMTPRMREIERMREDLDSLDDDVGNVRDAVLMGKRPGPRMPRHRTPAAGVPILLPDERTESNDE